MNTAKEEIQALLERLPENCSIEDVQYHLYLIEKVRRGIARADSEGTLSQEEVERRLSRWTSE
ncbi:MAG: hypothetical protein SCH98_04860 [Deferrisomatales bacterium]|nr:hypothetical protein [Deferrisomatales bacterium]